MKTKEYVLKYKLNESSKFNHKDFISDITFDFISLLEVGNATKNIKGFENAVRALRTKWDAINNKTVGQLPDKLWNYFYATVIAKMRNELFPSEMERRQKEYEERKKRQEEYRRFNDDIYSGFGFNFWDYLLGSLLTMDTCPVNSFETLGLSKDATSEEVNVAFRKLSMIHHPDKGGNNDKFIEIVEAKNKCLTYLK